MKKYIKYLIILSAVLVFSCDDLDRFPNDQPTSETFYSTEDELILAINAVYNDLVWVQARYVSESLLDMTTDIAFNRGGHQGFQAIARGEASTFTQAFDVLWTNYYRGINKSNNILDNMHRAKNMTNPTVFARIEAEARFLRAFYYHRLSELYGDVPLITSVLPVGQEFVSRTPKEQVTAFVISELQAASAVLPVNYPASQRGRATKGTALSILARVALYNGNYNLAADAAKKIMDLGEYTLHPSFRNLFTYDNEGSKEVIWEYRFLDGLRMHGTPRNNQSRMGGGFSTQVPLQTLVDSYECIDGLTIDESPLYNPANPFANRDPRLDGTVILPNTPWAGFIFETHRDSVRTRNLTTTALVNNQDVLNPFASFSGYLFKKYLDDRDNTQLERSSIHWILIRYAEVLLMYAEAKVEAGQIDVTVLDAINQVRARAYGANVTDTDNYPAVTTQNAAELRKIIRRERKVEFAYEGLRLFDIKRWRIGETVLNGPALGRPVRDYSVMGRPVFDDNTTPSYPGFQGVFRVIENRTFNPSRDYLWAIPQNDMNVNSNLVQNPGY